MFKKSRKVVILQFNIIVSTKSEQRFQILLQFLSSKYNVIRNVIDAQNDSDIKSSFKNYKRKRFN